MFSLVQIIIKKHPLNTRKKRNLESGNLHLNSLRLDGAGMHQWERRKSIFEIRKRRTKEIECDIPRKYQHLQRKRRGYSRGI